MSNSMTAKKVFIQNLFVEFKEEIKKMFSEQFSQQKREDKYP